ncbi:Uncharacterised protein [uncultured Blautia sp.]|nr:Uncharacterised protein [uncultured Blautia sp.]
MALDLARLDLICIYIVAVEQINGLGHHFHVSQFLCCDIQKQVLDLLVLDAEALGQILHGRFQLTVAASQLLLQQCCILGIRPLHGHRME